MMETERTTGPAQGPMHQTLIRPSTGRVLAGVAAAIANRFALPVWLVRAIFVILALSGGVGAVLYVAGWVLIPGEGDAKATAGQFLDRIEGPRAWVGIGLMALAAIIVADSTRLLEADLMAAGVLILIGVLLYRGDIGSPRSAGERPANEEESRTMTYVPSGGSTTDTLDLSGPAQPPSPPPSPPPVPAAPLPPAPPPPPRERSILGRLTMAVGLITLGVMALLDNLGVANATFRHYVAAGIIVIGVGLLVGSVLGRARGLIVLGVIMTPVVLFSPITEFDFDETSLLYSPVTVADIQDTYSLPIGSMEIDLSGVDFDGGQVTVDAEVGMGELIITVPDDVAVEAYGNVGLGDVLVFGSNSAGMGDLGLRRSVDGDNGTLIVEGRTDIGRVEIRRLVETQTSPVVPLGGDQIDIDRPDELDGFYDLGVGDYVFDLGNLTLTEEQDVTIELGTGSVTVILPASTSASVDASVGVGNIFFPDGSAAEGLAPQADYQNGDDPLLSITIDVGAGEVSIEDGMR
ncbi:MAG: PspC domain-containing protein [Acidimicrobiia bacterium]